jgi:hypothetical protein
MINIITSFYISVIPGWNNNEERQNELKECLNINLKNENIEKIHLFLDDENALNYINKLNNNKINIVSIGIKPTYKDYFKYSLENLSGKICMITNSDIYLHTLDLNLMEKLNDCNTVFSLTRYEYDMSAISINNYCGSHDCFIFKSPINLFESINNLSFPQNVWGSENKVLFEMKNNGIVNYNPCFQIKIVHLHKSDVRNLDRIKLPKKNSWVVKPSFI